MPLTSKDISPTERHRLPDLGGIHAQSTIGSFLRSFTHGHIRQSQAATGRFTSKAGSGRGAASLVAEAIRTLCWAGLPARILVRADSAFFSAKLVKGPRRRDLVRNPGQRPGPGSPDAPRHRPAREIGGECEG